MNFSSKTHMKLLVSVRNSKEALMAAGCGVPIIDLKEPLTGSLGSVEPAVVRLVSQSLNGRTRLSLAMGELVDFQNHDLSYLAGIDYVKVGLSAIPNLESLSRRWNEWGSRIGAASQPVVVGYADFERCCSIDLNDLGSFAIQVAAPFFLIDTWQKDGRRLLDWISIGKLNELVSHLAAAGVKVALAGSLDDACIAKLLHLPAAVIAVRGAACRQGQRTAEIDPRRIEALLRLLEQRSLAR
jgi:uncharacterized protein (UPF0264 family)